MKTNDKSAGINDIEHDLQDVGDELQEFEERQVNVTRTLQMIVYPAMVAFIILSAYGFFQVFPQSSTASVIIWHHIIGIDTQARYIQSFCLAYSVCT